MRLTEEDLSRLETLARIRLGSVERETLRLQLAGIIDFVRQLESEEPGEEPVDKVENSISGDLRVDVPGDCLEREKVLQQAPDRMAGHFRVPAVIESNENVSNM